MGPIESLGSWLWPRHTDEGAPAQFGVGELAPPALLDLILLPLNQLLLTHSQSGLRHQLACVLLWCLPQHVVVQSE